MIDLRKTARTYIGVVGTAGLIAALTACSGVAPTRSPVAQPTITAESPLSMPPAPAIAPVPADNGSSASPAPAKGVPAIAPALAIVAPAPPPEAVGRGVSSVAVGAPGIASIAPAPMAPKLIGSANSFAPQVAPASATEINHGIVVSGSGRVELRPDQATVTAGVQSRGRTAQEAQTLNNKAMAAVLASIKGLGIPDKDIQTVGIQLYPVFDQGQTVTGYSSTNMVTVLVENVDQAGPVLDAAITSGANESTNVSFGLKDETAARNKALGLAVADARSKADALAAALGLHISDVQSVTEGATGGPIFTGPRPMAAAADNASVPVEPGQLNVTAQVTIVFGY